MEFQMKSAIPLSICLFALPTFAFANSTSIQSDMGIDSGKFYVGVFGGGGSSKNFSGSQLGTAFFPEASGGPLAVNAFGKMHHKKTTFFGTQLGFQMREICLCSSSKWSIGPAVELEGYYMNRNTFKGDLINDTTRLPEHDFLVSCSMKRSVFLANAVVSFNNPCFFVYPYVGLGFGSAVIKITNAKSEQISPAEPGINHFNSNTRDTKSTFAGQIKLGLSFDINECLSLFAEYRWLYLANTQFDFGSTVYPQHVPTTSWQVKLGDQKYNLANVGIKFIW